MRGLMAAVAAMTLAGATGAAAEDWQLAGVAGDTVIGVDVSSIEVDGQFRAASVMLVFGQTHPDGTSISIAAIDFDCVEHAVAVFGQHDITADGVIRSTGGDGAEAHYDPIRPGSLFQAAEDMVCAGKRDPLGVSDPAEFAAVARRFLLETGAR